MRTEDPTWRERARHAGRRAMRAVTWGTALAAAITVVFVAVLVSVWQEQQQRINATDNRNAFLTGQLQRVEVGYTQLRIQLENHGIVPTEEPLTSLLAPAPLEGGPAGQFPALIKFTILGRHIECVDPTRTENYTCSNDPATSVPPTTVHR